ncbi:MAG TPA: hypothetical protein VF306_16325 [Pirellulales bacterium]
MRLTLRTMLAFMDDILEPADARDVGKKIEESEFATTLMHRMRDVTRRLRIGAPKLHGRGLGLDANTVAEYLDNTLPSERVAEFEKVCLESDVHLAEVTAAHQVLALVLGEPAEVETTGKQRMYRLPSDAEALARRDAVTKPSDGADRRRRRRKKKRRQVEVPDYLREPAEPQRRSRRPLVALLALLLIGAAAYGGYVWVENHPDQVAFWRGGDVHADGGGAEIAGTPAANADQADNANQVENGTPGPTANNNNNSGKATAPADAATPQAANESTVDQPEKAQDKSRDESSAPPPSHREGSPEAQTGDAEDSAEPVAPPSDAGARRVPRASDQATNKARPPRADTPNDDDEPAPAGEGAGRLISEHDVLVRLSGKQVRRVPARGTVYVGESLVALPAYRPSIVLPSGMTVQLYGGAQAKVAALDGDGVPEIHLNSGRLVLLSAARPELRVRLRAGDQVGTVTFGQEDAVLAVEVIHRVIDGNDPEQEPAPVLVDLYVVSGEIAWQGEQGESETIRGKAHWPLGRGAPAGGKKAEDLPVWIEENDLTPIERRAAAAVESHLHADKPAGPVLVDLLAHRMQENTILAVQSLALLGEFEPLVPLLNDPTRRRLDNSDIVSLRAAVARGPDSAAQVRQAFESVRGEKQGGELYRMLWGYSPEQLEEGGAAQLIEWLSHEDLDYRVLSFWNLHHITGFSYYYKPENTEAKRRTPVQRWRQKLEAGLIAPKAEPAEPKRPSK